MQTVADRPEAPNAIRNDLVAIFVSLELSRSTWLITSLSPDGGEKMSKHSVPAGDIYALLARFSEFKQRAFAILERAERAGLHVERPKYAPPKSFCMTVLENPNHPWWKE
jgi:hypothetical protein